MANRFPDSSPRNPSSIENNDAMFEISQVTTPSVLVQNVKPGNFGHKTVKHGNLRIAPDGTMSFKKTEADVLMCAIQLGISHHLAKLHPKPKRDLLIPDFHSVDNTEFPHEGSEVTPGHKYHDFKFKSYSPIAFRHLRDHFNIAPQDFISSLCYTPLNAIGNPGASGSLFYISQDDEFIIKTVSSREALFLQKLLPGYWINLHQNKRTLLPKFFGLYSYTSKGTKKIRLVVMNNLLPSNLEFSLKFDLKGSLHGRNASSKELEKSHPTFKDNDYLNLLGNGIVISPEKYDLLIETLQRDCTVLESFEIMDYSLLVAMHNISEVRRHTPFESGLVTQINEHHSTATLRLSMSLDNTDFLDNRYLAIVPASQLDNGIRDYLRRLPDGYFLAKLPSGDLTAVYLGIIDILQSYVTKKKLEHTFKSIIYDGDNVSVHRPNFYSKRFQNFMSRNVFIRDPNQIPVNDSSVGPRRKQRRTSLSTKSCPKSLNDSYCTPPSYFKETPPTSPSIRDSRLSDFSVQSINEDDLIRYSQLDMDRKLFTKNNVSTGVDKLFDSSCNSNTKSQNNLDFSAHKGSEVSNLEQEITAEPQNDTSQQILKTDYDISSNIHGQDVPISKKINENANELDISQNSNYPIQSDQNICISGIVTLNI